MLPKILFSLSIVVLLMLGSVEVLFAQNSSQDSGLASGKDQRAEKFLLGSRRSEDSSEQPLYIKSKTLEVDGVERVFNYRGKVEIIRGDIQITAEKVTGRYDKNQEIEKIICEEQVVLTRANGERASANKAVYDVPAQIIRLTEGPELFKGGSILSADLVKIYVAEEKSEAEGNVKVKVIKTAEQTSTGSIFKPLEEEEFEEEGDNGQ